MCLALYLGSSIELPTLGWDEQSPSFFVNNAGNEVDIKIQFSKQNLYYVGAHSGCGCGFKPAQSNDDEQDAEDIKEQELQKESLETLIRYLESALERTDELEFYICWEGGQGKTPKKKAIITPDEIIGIDWSMDTREFYKIVKSKKD